MWKPHITYLFFALRCIHHYPAVTEFSLSLTQSLSCIHTSFQLCHIDLLRPWVSSKCDALPCIHEYPAKWQHPQSCIHHYPQQMHISLLHTSQLSPSTSAHPERGEPETIVCGVGFIYETLAMQYLGSHYLQWHTTSSCAHNKMACPWSCTAHMSPLWNAFGQTPSKPYHFCKPCYLQGAL